MIDYHQKTNNHLSPLPSTNKESSLTINVRKTNSHLSPLPSTNKQSAFTITICLFVDGNGER
jgi:hypothetical protein